MNKRNPWFWVPTLYFAEGVPYFVVNNISVMMFAKMGVPNGQMAFFTTLLYFPWFLKGLWSPFVDVMKTKRWWIVTMQALLSVLLILLTLTLPHPAPETIASGNTGIGLFRFTLLLFIIAAFASATHDIAADGFYMLAQDSGSQAAFIGVRNTFYRVSSIFGQGVLVFIAGRAERATGDIPLSWQVSLGVAAVVFCLVTLYHTFVLPRCAEDCPREGTGASTWRELGNSFKTFFTKKGVVLAVVFMLLYRLPEGFLIKLCQPFLIDSAERGGLALGTDTVGIVYGTVGVAALLLGGILGGVFASRVGLKKAFWWMAAAITLPDLVYVYLAAVQPSDLTLIYIAIAVEQFGYGFGFTAYTLYMMYFSDGAYKTSHYAICTAFMALSMMLPGFVAGFIQEAVGYLAFFWMVILCCLATLVAVLLVRRNLPADYGRK